MMKDVLFINNITQNNELTNIYINWRISK